MEQFIYKTRSDGLSVLNLQKIDERVAALEARLAGTDFINHDQAKQYIDAVSILGDMLKTSKTKMASPYAVIHN